MGLVHFWCIFLDIEKAHKIDNQFLVGFIQRKEGGIDYYADQSLLRLTSFPSLAAGLLAQSSRGIRPVAEVERLPKYGCYNRRLLSLTDDG